MLELSFIIFAILLGTLLVGVAGGPKDASHWILVFRGGILRQVEQAEREGGTTLPLMAINSSIFTIFFPLVSSVFFVWWWRKYRYIISTSHFIASVIITIGVAASVWFVFLVSMFLSQLSTLGFNSSWELIVISVIYFMLVLLVVPKVWRKRT